MHMDEMLHFLDGKGVASSPDATARIILKNMQMLRKGEPPDTLFIDFLASAFEKSMVLPQSKRGPALLRELGLTYGSRRPSEVEGSEVAKELDALIASGQNRTQAWIGLCEKFGLGEKALRILVKKHDADMAAHYARENC